MVHTSRRVFLGDGVKRSHISRRPCGRIGCLSFSFSGVPVFWCSFLSFCGGGFSVRMDTGKGPAPRLPSFRSLARGARCSAGRRRRGAKRGAPLVGVFTIRTVFFHSGVSAGRFSFWFGDQVGCRVAGSRLTGLKWGFFSRGRGGGVRTVREPLSFAGGSFLPSNRYSALRSLPFL